MTVKDITSLKYYKQRLLALKKDGEYNETAAKKIVLDIAPEIGDFDDPKHNKRVGKSAEYKRIINSIAAYYGLMLASLLVSHLTNPQARWFFLNIESLKRKLTRDESIWLRDCENIMYEKLSSSKLHQTINNVYYEGITVGTGVMAKKSVPGGCVYLPLTTGQYWIDEDEFGDVNILARKFAKSAENLADMFGYENLPERVKKDLNKGARNNLFNVIHFVEPNQKYLPDWNNPYNKPFISTYYLECFKANEAPLEQKGISEFPYYVLRWDKHGTNTYGSGIGKRILGDVRMLQSYERDLSKASKKIISPPLKGSPDLKNVEKKGGANDITYTNNPEGFTPLYNVNYSIQEAVANIERLEERIKSYFYIDIFFALMGRDKTMSATEAAAVDQEKLVILGAVIDRIRTEYLDKIVEDMFIDLLRQGVFPPIPESLEGQEINIRYQSVLLQSMEMTDLISLERYLQFTAQQQALDPKAGLAPKTLEINDYYAQKLGINKSNINSPEEVEEMWQELMAKERATAGETDSKAVLNQAKAVNELSDAKTTGENALTDLLNATS